MASTADHEDLPDGGSMMDFVQKQMSHILEPFIQNIDHLHQVVERLSGELKETDLKAATNQEQLTRQGTLIMALRADHDDTAQEGKATQALLDKTMLETTVLEEEHKQTRSHAEDIEKHLNGVAASTHELQQDMRRTSSIIDQINSALSCLDGKLDNLAPQVQQLRVDLIKVDAAQQETAQLAKGAADSSYEVGADLRMLTTTYEQQKAHDKESFAQLNAVISRLGANLGKMHNKWEAHGDLYRNTNALVAPIGNQVVELSSEQAVLQRQQNGTAEDVEQLKARLNSLGLDLGKLMQELGAATDDDGGMNVKDEVQYLKSTAAQHKLYLDGLEKAVKSHHEELTKGERRTGNLESEEQMLEDRIHGLEVRVGVDPAQSVQHADVARQQKQKMQQVVAQMSILTKQKLFKDKIENHDQEFEKTHARAAATTAELESTSKRVHYLESELASTQDNVQKLRGGMELMQDYWKGLGKGLRETHRKVNAESKMKMDRTAVPILPSISQPQSPIGSMTAR